MIDVLQVPGFLDPATLPEVRADLARAAGAPATLLSGASTGVVRESVRRTTRIPVTGATRELLVRLLGERRAALEEHFGIPLGEFEEPQALRYEEGDYFVAHQDGNTPLVFDRSRTRRVSAVLFLSTHAETPAPDSYGGGALVFHSPPGAPEQRLPLNPPAGTLVAFRSETTHEVTPVTHGERYTIVTWFHAAE